MGNEINNHLFLFLHFTGKLSDQKREWQADFILKSNRFGQMTGECGCSLDLLVKVGLVYIIVRIIYRVIIRVKVTWVTVVVLVLHGCSNAILTEWAFITSGTAGNHLRDEI